MRDYTKRRKRRRTKAKLKNPKAVRAHKHIAGRTGAIQHKKAPSTKRFNYARHIPNPPFTQGIIG